MTTLFPPQANNDNNYWDEYEYALEYYEKLSEEESQMLLEEMIAEQKQKEIERRANENAFLYPHPKQEAFYINSLPRPTPIEDEHMEKVYEQMQKNEKEFLRFQRKNSDFSRFQFFKISYDIFQYLGFVIFLVVSNFFLILGFYHFLNFLEQDSLWRISIIFGFSIFLSAIAFVLITQGDEQ